MNASVVVCTYNRASLLQKALDSLCTMSLPTGIAWEVLAIDNNSRDATKEVCDSFSRSFPHRFRYIFEARQGKSFALNTAIEQSKGQILAFTDDDVTADPRWLEQLLATLEKFDCMGVAGKIIPVWNRAKPSWFADAGPNGLLPAIVSFDLGAEPAPLKVAPFGANVAFRRAAFQKFGTFRTDLGLTGQNRVGAEDTEFCRRLLKGGERIYYAPDAVIYHPVEEARTQKSYFQNWYLGRGRASIREEGVPVGAVRYFRVPRYLYALLLKQAAAWFFSLNPDFRFHRKLEVYETWGRILESRAQ